MVNIPKQINTVDSEPGAFRAPINLDPLCSRHRLFCYPEITNKKGYESWRNRDENTFKHPLLILFLFSFNFQCAAVQSKKRLNSYWHECLEGFIYL